MEDKPRARTTDRDERVGQSDGIEQLERARLNCEGARFVGAIERALDDAEGSAKPTELRGECESGWTGTDDQNREVDGRSRLGRLRLGVLR